MPGFWRLGNTVLYAGDCRDVLAEIDPVDAVVTDPPYHLVDMNARAKRSFAGNGDGSLARLGAGFMGKAWDGGDIAFRPETWSAIATVLKPGGYLLAFGGTRTHHRLWCAIEDSGLVVQDTIMWLNGQGFPKGRTQLKPAFEPICVAYKPGAPRALQIDECRIGVSKDVPASPCRTDSRIYGKASSLTTGNTAGFDPGIGRWPANVCHDGSAEVMAAFAAFRETSSGHWPASRGRGGIGCEGHAGQTGLVDRAANSGTAARFFYCAKAGKADRAGSNHPTVKPVALMRWLVRLVTPPGGVVLDPFAGSGTTGAAALADGRRAILIEREPEYLDDIRRRLNGDKAPAPARRRSAAQPAVCGVL